MEQPSVKNFIRTHSHKKISDSLNMFSYRVRSLLPSQIINRNWEPAIMLDVVPIQGYKIFLPIVIRSTSWLIVTNRIHDERHVVTCLHEERWPHFPRIALVGDSEEIFENNIQGFLLKYLTNSIKYWEASGNQCRIFISDRVFNFLKSNSKTSGALKKVETVFLSRAFKEYKVCLATR